MVEKTWTEWFKGTFLAAAVNGAFFASVTQFAAPHLFPSWPVAFVCAAGVWLVTVLLMAAVMKTIETIMTHFGIYR